MEVEDRPSLILVRSHIGYGSPHKQDTSAAHGSPLGEDEVRLTKEGYGWDPDKHFYVPDEALEHFRGCCARGKEFQAEWEDRFGAYRGQFRTRPQSSDDQRRCHARWLGGRRAAALRPWR